MKKRIHDKATRTSGSAGPVEWVQESVTATYDATQPTPPTNTPFPKGSLQNRGNAMRIPGGCSWYFHMQPGSVLVNAGDAVRRGQPMATPGNIGRTSGPTPFIRLPGADHVNVRDGSDSDVTASPHHARFPPGNGHPSATKRRRLWPQTDMTSSRANGRGPRTSELTIGFAPAPRAEIRSVTSPGDGAGARQLRQVHL